MEKTQAKPLTAAQQRQRDKKRRTWLRTGVQLFFFVSMPGAFVAGFSGVKQIFLHIGAQRPCGPPRCTTSVHRQGRGRLQ